MYTYLPIQEAALELFLAWACVMVPARPGTSPRTRPSFGFSPASHHRSIDRQLTSLHVYNQQRFRSNTPPA